MRRRRWISLSLASLAIALVPGCASTNISAGPTRTDIGATIRVPPPPPRAGAPDPANAFTSTLTGVYTDEQASVGKDIYSGQCLSCHSGEHSGVPFRRHWGGRDLSRMYRLISETMPQDNPGSLTAEQYASVIAYLLKLNGMPAGQTPLPTDTLALRKIRVDTLPTK